MLYALEHKYGCIHDMAEVQKSEVRPMVRFEKGSPLCMLIPCAMPRDTLVLNLVIGNTARKPSRLAFILT